MTAKWLTVRVACTTRNVFIGCEHVTRDKDLTPIRLWIPVWLFGCARLCFASRPALCGCMLLFIIQFPSPRLFAYCEQEQTTQLPIMRISQRDIRNTARKKLGISCRSDRNFRSNFVFAPKVIARAWNTLERKRLLPPKAKVKHLLWFLVWCKIYYTYDQAEGPCKCNRDTFEKWVMTMGKALQRLHTVSGKKTDADESCSMLWYK